MLRVLEEAKNPQYVPVPQNPSAPISQLMPTTPPQGLPQGQYYPTSIGVIRSDGTAHISLYAPLGGRIISATIQGTSLTTSNVNPPVLNQGNNDVILYFGNVGSLQVGQQYIISIVIHTGTKFELVNAIAIYQG